ncbi:MAG: AMP-binding protein [Archaeoglobaceae archaeon]|nr:AMP-binding protein [Archaeoglobaceae archaeon]MDW8128649.1 AMP-binding protein [Archaeoglobaceae archaeon]
MGDVLSFLQGKWQEKMKKLPKEPIYPFGRIPIHEYLQNYARKSPDKDFILYYGRRISFKEINELSNGFANFLISEGMKKGDRVALLLPNCPQFYIGYFGALKAGCVAVLLNPLLKELDLEYFFEQARPKVIFALDQVFEFVKKALKSLSNPKTIFTSFTDFLPENPDLEPHESMLKEFSHEEQKFSDLKLDTKDPGVEVSIEDYATMNFTGGTTGMPKPVLHRHRSAIYKGACMLAYSNANLYSGEDLESFLKIICENSVSLAVMPIFWIAGFDFGVVTPTIAGTTVVPLSRWSPKTAISAIKLYKVTDTYMTFDMYWEMINLKPKPEDLRSLRNCTGSSFIRGLNKDLRAKWKEITGTILREASYGLTETHTFDTITAGFQENDMDLELAEKHGATFCGIPCPGTDILIVNDKGEACEVGESGEVVIRSPSLVDCYLGKPEETKKAFKNGWFFTGDIGMFDSNGFFYFISRKKDLIKVSGISVYPTQIEFMLLKHPSVAMCAVVGVEDPEKGQVPVAFVKLRDKITEEELLRWCREKMAPYNVPKKIIFKETLPMTATGKVIKEELRKELNL